MRSKLLPGLVVPASERTEIWHCTCFVPASRDSERCCLAKHVQCQIGGNPIQRPLRLRPFREARAGRAGLLPVCPLSRLRDGGCGVLGPGLWSCMRCQIAASTRAAPTRYAELSHAAHTTCCHRVIGGWGVLALSSCSFVWQGLATANQIRWTQYQHNLFGVCVHKVRLELQCILVAFLGFVAQPLQLKDVAQDEVVQHTSRVEAHGFSNQRLGIEQKPVQHTAMHRHTASRPGTHFTCRRFCMTTAMLSSTSGSVGLIDNALRKHCSARVTLPVARQVFPS